MDQRACVVRQVVCNVSKPYDDRFTVVTKPETSYRRGRIRRPLLSAAEILTSLENHGLSTSEARRLVREARAAMIRSGWPAE